MHIHQHNRRPKICQTSILSTTRYRRLTKPTWAIEGRLESHELPPEASERDQNRCPTRKHLKIRLEDSSRSLPSSRNDPSTSEQRCSAKSRRLKTRIWVYQHRVLTPLSDQNILKWKYRMIGPKPPLQRPPDHLFGPLQRPPMQSR